MIKDAGCLTLMVIPSMVMLASILIGHNYLKLSEVETTYLMFKSLFVSWIIMCIIGAIEDRKAIWCFFFHRKYRKATNEAKHKVFMGIMSTFYRIYRCEKCRHQWEKQHGKSDVW